MLNALIGGDEQVIAKAERALELDNMDLELAQKN